MPRESAGPCRHVPACPRAHVPGASSRPTHAKSSSPFDTSCEQRELDAKIEEACILAERVASVEAERGQLQVALSRAEKQSGELEVVVSEVSQRARVSPRAHVSPPSPLTRRDCWAARAWPGTVTPQCKGKRR